jgi:N-acetylglucosaminyl-diphospho-decaprenol L-rhamnosyltransferase
MGRLPQALANRRNAEGIGGVSMVIDTVNDQNAMVTLSIVSHGQGTMIANLLADLSKFGSALFEVIITINIPEDESPYKNNLIPLKIIRNEKPKGFGSNHNAAFMVSKGRWFCVLNPDLRIRSLDLSALLRPFTDLNVAVVAPIVRSTNGVIQDNARRFPTAMNLFKRFIFRQYSADFPVEDTTYRVDWVAGMFMVFKRSTYIKVGGFDDRRFYMYFEDVDICRRIAQIGGVVVINPLVEVTHEAQRASHRNLQHLRWHLVSAFRFLTGL